MLARAKRILSGDIRPEDYLHTPDEVADTVHEMLAQFGEGQVSREFTRRMLNDWTLSFHYGGQHILCKETEQGVIVLALGEQIRAFHKEFPSHDDCPGVVGTVPWPWQSPNPPASPSR
jgi:hypothetical protein